MLSIVYLIELHIKLLLLPNEFAIFAEWGDVVSLFVAVVLGPLAYLQVSRFYYGNNSIVKSLYFGLMYAANTVASYVVMSFYPSVKPMFIAASVCLAAGFVLPLIFRAVVYGIVKAWDEYATV